MIVYNARSLKGVVQVQYDILVHLHTLLFHSYIIILIADPKIETAGFSFKLSLILLKFTILC